MPLLRSFPISARPNYKYASPTGFPKKLLRRLRDISLILFLTIRLEKR
jgi:hypothetical protein